MSTKKEVSFPILGILGVLFIGLKLTGYIAWSWWWVLAPFWGPFAVIVGMLFVVCAAAVIAKMME